MLATVNCDEGPCGAGLGPVFLVVGAGAVRLVASVVAHRYVRHRQMLLGLGAARGVANGILALALFNAWLPPDTESICTTAVCFTPPAALAVIAALPALVTFGAHALRKPEEAAGEKKAAADDAPILEDTDQTRSVTRDLVLPIVALAIIGVAASLYFLRSGKTLMLGGILGAVAFRVVARVFYYVRKPPTFYPVVVGVLRGVGFGLLGVLSLLEFVPDGPGMPRSAIELGVFIVCFSVLRQANTLVKGPGLPILLTLLGAAVVGGWAGYDSYRYLIGSLPIPFTGQLLWLLAVGYVATCVRALLAFAGEDESKKGATWMEWLRANFWRNLVFVGLLVGYLVFRDNLAQMIPFFPIVEFSLGMMTLGFVLTRVRTRIRSTLTETPTAAEWKPHTQRVERVSEADHDRVHEVIGSFITTGGRRDEYADIFSKAARVDGDVARALTRPVLEHRDTRRHAPLPYAATLFAWLAVAAGAAIALFVLIDLNTPPESEIVGIVPLGLAMAGVAAWLTQQAARRAESVGGLVTSGVLGAGLLGASLYGYALAGIGPAAVLASPSVLALVATLLLGLTGIPGYRAWRLAKDLRAGVVERDEAAREDISRAGFKRHAKLLAAWVITAFLVTFPANVAIDLLDSRDLIPDGFPAAYRNVQAPVMVLLASFAIASLVLMLGHAVARPLVAREDRQNRARRQELHQAMMRNVGSAGAAPPVPAPPLAPPTDARAPRASIVSTIFGFGKERL